MGTQRQSNVQMVGSTISRMESPSTLARADKPVVSLTGALRGAFVDARRIVSRD